MIHGTSLSPCLYPFSYTSVSYTHLDVYKRQLYTTATKWDHEGRVTGGRRVEPEERAGNSIRRGPTDQRRTWVWARESRLQITNLNKSLKTLKRHLDVYKRQHNIKDRMWCIYVILFTLIKPFDYIVIVTSTAAFSVTQTDTRGIINAFCFKSSEFWRSSLQSNLSVLTELLGICLCVGSCLTITFVRNNRFYKV